MRDSLGAQYINLIINLLKSARDLFGDMRDDFDFRVKFHHV